MSVSNLLRAELIVAHIPTLSSSPTTLLNTPFNLLYDTILLYLPWQWTYPEDLPSEVFRCKVQGFS